jgi:hypothetical protein
LLHWHHAEGGSAQLTAHSITVETLATEPADLLAEAFPDGLPSPAYENGQLSLRYLRDVAKTGFEVSAEASTGLQDWQAITHSVISAGPGFEVRQVTVPAEPSAYLRLRVTAQ